MIGLSLIGINEVLNDSNLLENFKLYAADQFASENLEFYCSVRRYKTLTNNQRKDAAQEIFDSFIKEDAQNELGCINYGSRERVEENLQLYPTSLFNEVEQMVLLDIRISLLPGFLQSEYYESVKPNSENNNNNNSNDNIFSFLNCLSVKS
eukprot:TRINITY_DN3678_c0_g1_i1.p1 TRINITY_DN3678_c0_g1~~TRINITY_DN3678_c0_g1_i1.p1  ORF type:complete len:151 (+),score=5.67 TRINITY_DN3678_c0_g1_i1:73-525(+)